MAMKRVYALLIEEASAVNYDNINVALNRANKVSL